jgi:hypothetical protein
MLAVREGVSSPKAAASRKNETRTDKEVRMALFTAE